MRQSQQTGEADHDETVRQIKLHELVSETLSQNTQTGETIYPSLTGAIRPKLQTDERSSFTNWCDKTEIVIETVIPDPTPQTGET